MVFNLVKTIAGDDGYKCNYYRLSMWVFTSIKLQISEVNDLFPIVAGQIMLSFSEMISERLLVERMEGIVVLVREGNLNLIDFGVYACAKFQ